MSLSIDELSTEFDTDMTQAMRWPLAVHLDITVDHVCGPPECRRWRFDPYSTPRDVHVSEWSGGAPCLSAVLPWNRLPGQSLYQRCFSVLAQRLFGSLAMPPRIVGTPMWGAIAASLSHADSGARPLQVELCVASDDRLLLSYRHGADGPLSRCARPLEGPDADPLRALLRLAMAGRVAEAQTGPAITSPSHAAIGARGVPLHAAGT